jgi:plastocyanin
MTRARRVLVGIAAMALLGAACGNGADGGDGVDDGGVAAETGTSTGATAATSASGPTGATGATGATGIDADVEASVNNYLFDPDPVEVASGDVLSVRNGNTKTPHTFTVVGQDVDLELGPLETETIEITLEPGTYDLICRFHESLDMTGTLIVT